MTIDIDLKPDPEPPGFFEALPHLKEELDINIELACPDQFIPALPGWRERSLFVRREGPLEFFHYDPYVRPWPSCNAGMTAISAMSRPCVRPA
jgi:hypothetical protein